MRQLHQTTHHTFPIFPNDQKRCARSLFALGCRPCAVLDTNIRDWVSLLFALAGRPCGTWLSQRSTRSQAAPQRCEQGQRGEQGNIVSKKRRMGEPEDTMDEQPDHRNWFDVQFENLEDEFTQFTNDVTTINDIDTTPEPVLEDLDPESPEYRKLITLKYSQPRTAPVRSSPPAIMTDAPTIDDPNDEVWHEASERSDDEQPPQ